MISMTQVLTYFAIVVPAWILLSVTIAPVVGRILGRDNE